MNDWTKGECLPPIGTICSVKERGGYYATCQIVAHVDDQAVFTYSLDDIGLRGIVGMKAPDAFKPLEGFKKFWYAEEQSDLRLTHSEEDVLGLWQSGTAGETQGLPIATAFRVISAAYGFNSLEDTLEGMPAVKAFNKAAAASSSVAGRSERDVPLTPKEWSVSASTIRVGDSVTGVLDQALVDSALVDWNRFEFNPPISEPANLPQYADEMMNSPGLLPPVSCPLVIAVDTPEGPRYYKATRLEYLSQKDRAMKYLLDGGTEISGRFEWTYP